jgi:hypothetical protein
MRKPDGSSLDRWMHVQCFRKHGWKQMHGRIAWMMLAVIDNNAVLSSTAIFLFIDMTCGAIPVIRRPDMIIHRLFNSVCLHED